MATKTEDESQITDLIQNWAKAVRAKDIEAIVANHAPDILLFDVPEPLQSKGMDVYRASWESQFFPWYGNDGEFELSELNVTAGTDIAFCHSIISCSGTTSGKKESLKIRLTVCLKKTDKKWVVVHEHHSDTSK